MKPTDEITAGMQVLFKDDKNELAHTGIVESVNPKSYTFKAIEGNITHSVVVREYAFNDPHVDSFIAPYYAENTITISCAEYDRLKAAFSDLETIRRIICGDRNG